MPSLAKRATESKRPMHLYRAETNNMWCEVPIDQAECVAFKPEVVFAEEHACPKCKENYTAAQAPQP